MKPLQEIFLKNLVGTIREARQRILADIDFLPEEEKKHLDAVVWEELQRLIHTFLCEFDGATPLADLGLISIVDENGQKFDRCLHELVFKDLEDDKLL
ncbi:hypothetical protein G8770_14500 [Aestuariicella hydrocarbonica]|uniref:Uncharacterized protein n=1 Tax=Pseudomaricurvus hydrocarbonicus TaxID=1470433 RepID=A0A9E5MLB8_9GAMM|nr:hypothetical protein [Aestuariicella hydrocarbonica]NHO66757.1 hypothetical protein [Aestuariicella hydrocarbonica]